MVTDDNDALDFYECSMSNKAKVLGPLNQLKGEKMENKPVILIAGTQCTRAELDERFNKWYDEVHIPMLLKSEWLEGVTRYKLAPLTEGDYPRYMVVYEFKDIEAFKAWDSSEITEAAREERKQSWADEDFEIKWRVVYEPMKSWHK